MVGSMKLWARLAPLLLLGGPSCSGADEITGLACPAIAEPAVVIELVDADTLAPIEGATLLLTDDNLYLEEMTGYEGRYQGGLERPGTYRVEIFAEGHEYALLEDIVVPEGPCGPLTEQRVVELEPLAPWSPARLILTSEAETLEVRGAAREGVWVFVTEGGSAKE